MKTNRFILLFVVLFLVSVFSECSSFKKEKVWYVLIETNLGNIKIQLYNETPLHRDNFFSLVDNKFYDGQTFHRVISEFMIQAGNPQTAFSDEKREVVEVDYTIPAEFHSHLFHKKGAVAAARQGDKVNPDQESSGSQFYIVQGKILDNDDLQQLEERINKMRMQSLFFKNINAEKEKAFNKDEPIDYAKIQQAATLKTEEQLKDYTPYTIPPDQKEVYKTIGGVPHLDGSYTVFGEVVEGFDVIDRIAAVKTDTSDRPLDDIRIRIKKVRK